MKWAGSGPGGSGGCATSAGTRSVTPHRVWFTSNATTAGSFSAVCLLTAKALHESLGGAVPVGAVESCVSGTSVERWMPPLSSICTPPWLPLCPRKPCHGDLWQSEMVPLLPMTFRAVLWDQGEADAKRTNASWYRDAWPAMINGWRQELRQPGLPLVYVELDGQMHDEAPQDSVNFWAAQRAATSLPSVGFATTTDIQRGTHPPDKQDVAARMALEVRRVALGQAVVSRGPELHRISGSATGGLVLTFSNMSLVSSPGILVNTSCAVKNPPRWC